MAQRISPVVMALTALLMTEKRE